MACPTNCLFTFWDSLGCAVHESGTATSCGSNAGYPKLVPKHLVSKYLGTCSACQAWNGRQKLVCRCACTKICRTAHSKPLPSCLPIQGEVGCQTIPLAFQSLACTIRSLSSMCPIVTTRRVSGSSPWWAREKQT